MVMRPGKALGDLAVDPLQQAPALLEHVAFVALVTAHAADVERHVEAQPVEVVLVEPVERVVADELADLAAAVVGPGVAPGRVAAPVVVEVDAALVVLAPAVEPPEVEVARAEMVVDDVEDHGDPAPMRGLDEGLEAVGAAVGALDGEDVGGVVAPGDVPGELHRRHDLHRVDPEPLQMAELVDGIGEGSGRVLVGAMEGADVHLVDDELVPRPSLETAAVPVVRRIDHDAVADRGRHRAGVGVDPGEHRFAVADQEAVLVARLGRRDVRIPHAAVLRRHRGGVFGPVVERAGQEDRLRVRRPHPEGDTGVMDDGPHLRARSCVRHGFSLRSPTAGVQRCRRT